jgi:hypothetical protein
MKCGECGPAVRETASGGRVRREEKKKKRQASWLLEGQWCGESTGRRRFQKGGRSIVEKKNAAAPRDSHSSPRAATTAAGNCPWSRKCSC